MVAIGKINYLRVGNSDPISPPEITDEDNSHEIAPTFSDILIK